MAVKALKMAVVFGECGRECLSGPGNTEVFSVLAGRGGGQKPVSEGRHIEATHTHQTDSSTTLTRDQLFLPPPPATLSVHHTQLVCVCRLYGLLKPVYVPPPPSQN